MSGFRQERRRFSRRWLAKRGAVQTGPRAAPVLLHRPVKGRGFACLPNCAACRSSGTPPLQPTLDSCVRSSPGSRHPGPHSVMQRQGAGVLQPIARTYLAANTAGMAKPLPVMLETWEAAEEFRQRAVAKLQAIDIAMVAEGIVSKRIDGTYRSGPCPVWIKVRNPASDAVQRERSEKWNR
jgi:hypothetical protein